MATYDNKKDEIIHKHVDEVIELKVSRLVNNQQMLDNETNWHRGYIAACRDFMAFYHGDLQKKLNEG